MQPCQFVPPYLLERVAVTHPDDVTGAYCQSTLAIDSELRERRFVAAVTGTRVPSLAAEGPLAVHTADNGTTLPGRLVRGAGDAPTGDAAVDEAYTGVEASLALFSEVYGRSSYDDAGAPVLATVHFGRNYDNAFWDGGQLVFGDGDGRVFERFTKPVDVLGHEFTHAVTLHTSGFVYQGQSGALNESVSDVFASCLKQRLLGQSADEADWLVGEGIFLPSVNGRALRSMAEPGTAYDDPVLGRDPQVGSMADYVETTQDNGGVHLNSGIPNRAYYLAALALGGNAWEGAGRIWYAALTAGLDPGTGFSGFAAATVSAAGGFAASARDAVAAAWAEVGVATAAPTPGPPTPGSPSAGGEGGVVAVTRSGGIVGRVQTAEVRLGEDPRATEVRALLSRIDLSGVTASRPQPDRYVYSFNLGGREVVLGEQDLTPDLAELARLLLDR